MAAPRRSVRPPPAAPREHLDELVAGDRRERDRRRDEPGDPDRVAFEQVEQVRLRGVERPREEPRLHERREHQEAQRGLRRTEVDARAGVARDLPGQLASRDPTRREAEVVHHDPGDDEDGHEEHGADDVRQREVDLAEQPAADRPDEHRRTRDLLAASEDAVEHSRVARGGERVDEPRLHCPRVEREPEPHRDRDGGERHDARADLRERDVEQRRRREHRDGEEEGDAAPERVRDDAGRHLEHDHSGGERGVRDEDLEEAQPGVEQEERVDAPDRRRRKRVEPGQREVAGEDAPAVRWPARRSLRHGRSLEPRPAASPQ